MADHAGDLEFLQGLHVEHYIVIHFEVHINVFVKYTEVELLEDGVEQVREGHNAAARVVSLSRLIWSRQPAKMLFFSSLLMTMSGPLKEGPPVNSMIRAPGFRNVIYSK